MFTNLVAIEFSYVNSPHPDFSEELALHLQQAQCLDPSSCNETGVLIGEVIIHENSRSNPIWRPLSEANPQGDLNAVAGLNGLLSTEARTN